MNKNDFYKELLSQYTFDSEKIKMNAKRQKRGFWQSPAKFIPTVATAAAVTVTIGVFTFMAATSGNITQITPRGSEVSAAQRLEEAEENYRLAAISNTNQVETVDMYVSFNSPLTYNEAVMLFSSVSDTGEIDFVILYTADKKITSADDISAFAKSDEKLNGVKITSPSNYYKSIQDLSAVSVVELFSDTVNDDTFTPISSEIISEITTVETATQLEITTPVQTEPVNTSENLTIGDSAATEIKEETTPAVNEVVTLEYAIQGINDAIFINETDFIALTNSTVELHRIVDEGEKKTITLVSRIAVENPKISWSNDSNTTLFISGCDSDKTRNMLYYANGRMGTLTQLDISDLTVDAEMSGMFFNEDTADITLKTFSLSKTYVYTGSLTNDGLSLELSVESEVPVVPLAYQDDILYYAYAEDGVTYVHRLDTLENADEEIWNHEGSAKFARSALFDNAAIAFDDETYIFMSSDESFNETNTAGSIIFSCVNSAVFSDDNGYYAITAAGVMEISSEAADVYFTEPENSIEYSVYEILTDCVRIKIR